ncbi:MAG: DUF4365 domain-containing protein [Candidatus Latescibacterota bacterium]
MTNNEYKQVTAQAKAGIKGEAFFESLVSDHSLPHHIVGSKDLGIDYICEWIYGDRPSGILYAVQVKTFSQQNVRITDLGPDRRNQLRRYSIEHNYLEIDARTQRYWRGLGMPVYLFVIVYSESQGISGRLDCYYQRFTPILTTNATQEQADFYKVNDGTTFLAFADQNTRIGGFARDLFIDLMRCSYSKGSISYISPRIMGLEQFPEEDAVFKELFGDYREIIRVTYDKTRRFLEQLGVAYDSGSSASELSAVPSAGPPEDDDDIV